MAGAVTMTEELRYLAYSTALLIVVVLIQAAAGVFAQGIGPMAGHRDNLPPPKTFQARTKRLADNHIEGLLMFAPLVIIADLIPLSNHWTVLGSQIFFFSRCAHAVAYLTGVPWIRALFWGASMAATIMILLALFGIIS